MKNSYEKFSQLQGRTEFSIVSKCGRLSYNPQKAMNSSGFKFNETQGLRTNLLRK